MFTKYIESQKNERFIIYQFVPSFLIFSPTFSSFQYKRFCTKNEINGIEK